MYLTLLSKSPRDLSADPTSSNGNSEGTPSVLAGFRETDGGAGAYALLGLCRLFSARISAEFLPHPGQNLASSGTFVSQKGQGPSTG